MLVGRADDGNQAAHIRASTLVCCGVVSCSKAHISAKFIGRQPELLGGSSRHDTNVHAANCWVAKSVETIIPMKCIAANM